MQAQNRREKIKKMLSKEKDPLSASRLAKQFGVSRQVIVGDIALLRAGGLNIDATPRGYLINRSDNNSYIGTVACKHTKSDMRTELYTIVDLGGKIIDVIVDHPIYGQLTGRLQITSRYDVDQFMQKTEKENAQPLSKITDGVHLHTISCNDKLTFYRIVSALRAKGVLYDQQD